jgi:ligand-binding sensor domain-containing protein
MHNKVLLTLTPNGPSSVFVGTYGNGVYQVEANGTAQEAYSIKKGNFNANYVTTVIKDTEGDLWIGNIEGKLGYVHNGKATYFPIYAAECLTYLDKNRIVAGTPNGFYIINKKTLLLARLYCYFY